MWNEVLTVNMYMRTHARTHACMHVCIARARYIHCHRSLHTLPFHVTYITSVVMYTHPYTSCTHHDHCTIMYTSCTHHVHIMYIIMYTSYISYISYHVHIMYIHHFNHVHTYITSVMKVIMCNPIHTNQWAVFS
jgi:hypothetical protein